MHTNAKPCRPRLFIHQLPDSFREPAADNSSVGAPLTDGGDGMLYHSEHHRHVGPLLLQRAATFYCQTLDPSAADLFLIPAYRSQLIGREGRCAEAEGVVGNATLEDVARERFLSRLRPALDARGGADHVLLQPRLGMLWEQQQFCELHDFDPALGAVLRIAVEQGTPQRPNGYHSIPYISMVHLGPHSGRRWPSAAGERPLPWVSSHRRAALVAMVFETYHARGKMPRANVKLRQVLWASCHRHRLLHQQQAAATGPPQPMPAPSGGRVAQGGSVTRGALPRVLCDHAISNNSSQLSYASMAEAYNTSTFCVQPPGDTPTRKGIVDALLLGCIPVSLPTTLTHPARASHECAKPILHMHSLRSRRRQVLFDPMQLTQWRWHWGRWAANATMLLNGTAVRKGKVDVVETLRRIPQSRVRAMRRTIREEAHVMQWATADSAGLRSSGVVAAGYEDAFDVLIRRAWERSRSRSLQARGARVQVHSRSSPQYRRWSQSTAQFIRASAAADAPPL